MALKASQELCVYGYIRKHCKAINLCIPNELIQLCLLMYAAEIDGWDVGKSHIDLIIDKATNILSVNRMRFINGEMHLVH